MPLVENGQFKPRHGHTSSRGGKTTVSLTYSSWSKMKDRVLNPNHMHHAKYASVAIAPRWMSFENFLADMGPRPSAAHSIERKDGTGNYEANNCYWATPQQQARNRCTNRLLTYQKDTKTAAEWIEVAPVSKVTFFARLRRGWSMEAIMTASVIPNGKGRTRNASGQFN